MHVKKQTSWKHERAATAIFRSQQDTHGHGGHGTQTISQKHQNFPAVMEESTPRGLTADVLFFVDHAISLAVDSVARKQAERARLMVTGKSGTHLHVSVSATGEGEDTRFVAYNNDMCLFVGSSPSLYVVDPCSRELEHSIYLYISERLSAESAVTAQIFRETGTMFELPILEGNSELGPRSLKPRQRQGVDD